MLLRYKTDTTEYAQVSGRVYFIKYRESVGQNNKPMATFAVACGREKDDYDKWTNLYMNCLAWSNIAELIGEIAESDSKVSVIVCGEIKQNEYNGKITEQLIADYIAIQQDHIGEQSKKAKHKVKNENDFDDIEY